MDSDRGEEWERRRRYGCLGTALVVICFDVSNPESFRNVSRRWIPEILHFFSSPRVPVLLVGCKTDLRAVISGSSRGGGAPVSSEQGYTAAATIGAERYMECSALAGEGVDDITEAAVQIATSWDPRPRHLRESACRIV